MCGEIGEMAGGEWRGEGGDGGGAPVVGAVLGAVDEIAGVVAGAVGAAVAEEVGGGEVGADLLGRRPEVVDVVLLVGQDGAIGDEDTVGGDTLARVRQVKSVVVDGGIGGVGEAVKVPVSLFVVRTIFSTLTIFGLRES